MTFGPNNFRLSDVPQIYSYLYFNTKGPSIVGRGAMVFCFLFRKKVMSANLIETNLLSLTWADKNILKVVYACAQSQTK